MQKCINCIFEIERKPQISTFGDFPAAGPSNDGRSDEDVLTIGRSDDRTF